MIRFVSGLLMVALAGACGAQAGQSPGQPQLRAMPGARAEAPDSRVGQTFWIQRKGRPFSIDFFRDAELRERIPLEDSGRFVVAGLTRTNNDQSVYQVVFETGEQAFVAVEAFESDLYVDPPLTSETRFKASPYLSPEAYFYSTKSIFTEDPAALAERIDRLGPSRIITPGASPRGEAPAK